MNGQYIIEGKYESFSKKYTFVIKYNSKKKVFVVLNEWKRISTFRTSSSLLNYFRVFMSNIFETQISSLRLRVKCFHKTENGKVEYSSEELYEINTAFHDDPNDACICKENDCCPNGEGDSCQCQCHGNDTSFDKNIRLLPLIIEQLNERIPLLVDACMILEEKNNISPSQFVSNDEW